MAYATYRVAAGSLVAALLMLAGANGGCSSLSAAGVCKNACDKQESCGDVDSIKAEQCRKQCDANSTASQASLDKCENKSDIFTAAQQCIDRACTDYAKCFGTLPSCVGGSGTWDLYGWCSAYLTKGTQCCEQVTKSDRGAGALCRGVVQDVVDAANSSACQAALGALNANPSCGDSGYGGGSGYGGAGGWYTTTTATGYGASGDPCASGSDCESGVCETSMQCQ